MELLEKYPLEQIGKTQYEWVEKMNKLYAEMNAQIKSVCDNGCKVEDIDKLVLHFFWAGYRHHRDVCFEDKLCYNPKSKLYKID